MCCPAPLPCGNYSGQAERDSGIGLKLFSFIPESVFTFIPEHCSGSPRNGVRNHPGTAFTFARIPQTSIDGARAMLGGFGKSTVLKLLYAGEIASVVIGKWRLVNVASVKKLAESGGGEFLCAPEKFPSGTNTADPMRL